MMNKRGGFLLACMLVFSLLSSFAGGLVTGSGIAAGKAVAAGDCTLTVIAKYSQAQTPVSGFSLSLHQIAVPLGNDRFEVLSAYADALGNDIGHDDLTAENAARADAVAEGGDKGITAVTDSNGEAVFSGLDEGVYLLRHAADESNYKMTPVLVYVGADGEVVSPKFEYVSGGDKTTSVTVTKIWNDNDNSSGDRPDSVKVTLYMDGVVYKTATLNQANGFRHTFSDLPVGHEFTVEEEPIEKYAASYSGSAAEGFVILNKHAGVAGENRPNPPAHSKTTPKPSVTVKPVGTPDPSGTPDPNVGENPNKTPDPGNPGGNDPNTPGGNDPGNPGGSDPSNPVGNGSNNPNNPASPSPDKPSVSVRKVWDGSGEHPQSVRVFLIRNSSVINEIVLSAENGWEYTFGNLDANEKYTVYEDEVSGYGASYSGSGSSGFVITNTPGETNSGTPLEPSAPYVPDKTGASGGSTSGGGKIPQTGMVMWPVPALIAGGSVMIILGLLLMRRKRERNEC